jgi:hypothetical protein
MVIRGLVVAGHSMVVCTSCTVDLGIQLIVSLMGRCGKSSTLILLEVS